MNVTSTQQDALNSLSQDDREKPKRYTLEEQSRLLSDTTLLDNLLPVVPKCISRKGGNEEQQKAEEKYKSAEQLMTAITNVGFKYLKKSISNFIAHADFLYIICNIELKNSEDRTLCTNIQNAAELRNKVYHRKFYFYHHDRFKSFKPPFTVHKQTKRLLSLKYTSFRM